MFSIQKLLMSLFPKKECQCPTIYTFTHHIEWSTEKECLSYNNWMLLAGDMSLAVFYSLDISTFNLSKRFLVNVSWLAFISYEFQNLFLFIQTIQMKIYWIIYS